MVIPIYSEPLWWEKIGKVESRVKLAVPSDCEPLRWEQIGKVVNWVKLAIPSDSELLAVLEGENFLKMEKLFLSIILSFLHRHEAPQI